jgi:hypothetical protein
MHLAQRPRYEDQCPRPVRRTPHQHAEVGQVVPAIYSPERDNRDHRPFRYSHWSERAASARFRRGGKLETGEVPASVRLRGTTGILLQQARRFKRAPDSALNRRAALGMAIMLDCRVLSSRGGVFQGFYMMCPLRRFTTGYVLKRVNWAAVDAAFPIKNPPSRFVSRIAKSAQWVVNVRQSYYSTHRRMIDRLTIRTAIARLRGCRQSRLRTDPRS